MLGVVAARARDAEWKESEHPRGQPGNAGQFGSGGGGSEKVQNETWQGAKATVPIKDAIDRLNSLPKVPDDERWFNYYDNGKVKISSSFGPEVKTSDLGLRRGTSLVGMQEDDKSVDGLIPLDLIENTQPSVTVAKVKEYIENPPDSPIDVVAWRRSEDEPWRFISASGTHRMAAAKLRGVEKIPVRFQIWSRAGSKNVASQLSAIKFLRARGYEPSIKAHDMNLATDPPVSEAQRRAMFAAAAGHSTLGIPQSVGKEFSDADKGGKLPAKAKDMSTTDWRGLLRGLFKFLSEEAAEPEHQTEDEQPHTRAAGVAFVTPTGDCLFLKRAARGHAGDHATEWCLPGGEMEDGETAEDCARREATEEVGYDWDAAAHDPDDGRFTSGGSEVKKNLEDKIEKAETMRQRREGLEPDEFSNPNMFRNLVKAHSHVHDGVDFTTFYQPVAGQFNPKLNDEHTAYKWAPIDAPPEPLHPGVRKTLDEIVAGLGEDAAMATAPNAGIPAAAKTEDGTIDTATVDVPLLIRLMEYAREDAPDDEALHSATERLVALAQAENRPLKMEDYEKIVADAADPSGKLSETTREDVDSQKHREDMPEDAFLGPNRTYPVKEQRDGEWKYTRNLLLAAARRARMQGRGDIARRADAIRAREFGSEGEDETKHDPKNGQFTSGSVGGSSIVTAVGDPEAVASKLDISSQRGAKTGMYDTPYAALRVAMKDPSQIDKQIDRLTAMMVSSAIGREFGESVAQHMEKNPDLAKRHAEARAVIAHLQGMKKTSELEAKDSLGRDASFEEVRAAVKGKSTDPDALAAWIKDRTDPGWRGRGDAGLPDGRLQIKHQSDLNGGLGWAFGGRVGTGANQMRMSRAVRSGRGMSNTGTESVDGDMALDRAIAEDKRQFDHDGRMHVDSANITKVGVFPYLGKEVNAVMKDEPGWKMLDPEKRYSLLRPADEIEEAAGTFCGLPILWTHRPASAEAHPHEITIGATGNDCVFEYPYLKCSLSIWPAYATEAIEDGSQRQLSAGYAYKAVPEEGEFEGQPYQFKMTNMIGNHIALVRDGRSGADCGIDSSIEEQQWRAIEKALRALVA